MTQHDFQFALKRGTALWRAVQVTDRQTGVSAFRVSRRGKSRDAHGGADAVTDVEVLAKRVLLEGDRMRCAPVDGGPSSSLDLESRGVTGYVLDPVIAARLGIPATKDVP